MGSTAKIPSQLPIPKITIYALDPPSNPNDSAQPQQRLGSLGTLDNLTKNKGAASSTQANLLHAVQRHAKAEVLEKEFKEIVIALRNNANVEQLETLLTQARDPQKPAQELSAEEKKALAKERIDYCNKENIKVLDVACLYASPESIELLIKYDAQVNQVNERGITPLMFGMINKKHGLKVVKTLIDRGAKINTENRSTGTPLHFAASDGQMEICQYLIEKDADTTAKTQPVYLSEENKQSRTFTVPALAQARGHTDIANYIRNYNTEHLLYKAVNEGNVAQVNSLLEDKLVNVNYAKDNNYTALHYACKALNDVDMQSTKLLSDSEKVELKEKRKSYFKIAKSLINNGASIHLKTAEDKTPLQLLSKKRHRLRLKKAERLRVEEIAINRAIDRVEGYFACSAKDKGMLVKRAPAKHKQSTTKPKP